MSILQKIQAVNQNPNKNYHSEVLFILYRDMHLSFKVTINIQGKYVHDQSVQTKLYTTITVYTTKDITGKGKSLQDRMRTARLPIVWFRPGGRSCRGKSVWHWKALWSWRGLWSQPPPNSRQTDSYKKHYLPAISFVGGKNHVSLKYHSLSGCGQG